MSHGRGLVGWALLALVGCGDPASPDPDHGGAGGGGSGGAAAGSSGNGAAMAGGGTGTSGSSVGGGGQAGGATNLTGEALRDATHDECFAMCTSANQACQSYTIPMCLATCQRQADDAFAAEVCARELYDALRCINALGSEKIACDPNGVTFDGCVAEQSAYSGC